MATSQQLAQQIERLLASGANNQVLGLCDTAIATSKREIEAWLGRARANLALARVCIADEDLDMALRLAPVHAQANLLRGQLDQRLGNIDKAVDRLRKLALAKTAYSIEASFALAETLFYSHRLDEFQQFIAHGGAWTADPRAAFFRARARARLDPAGAIDDLLEINRQDSGTVLKRIAGFDAVQLLDKAGRYREAFDVATKIHNESTPAFDLEGLLRGVRQQAELLKKGAPWFTPRADAHKGVAMVVALPRSGTTLLEQMLDAHSHIGAIGEYDGVQHIADGAISAGFTMQSIGMLPRELAKAMQLEYLNGANKFKRAGTEWAFDKNLRAWSRLPVIAAILPGTVCFHVARDPRDMAISTFLSFFHPISDGWTSSMQSLRTVIEAERSILPQALSVLGIAHEQVVYEDLVADPAGHASRCLERLGLQMEPGVLSPERNARAVFTLSHAQVKQPINRGSIGRWKNYEFAFDDSWRELAAVHDARRTR